MFLISSDISFLIAYPALFMNLVPYGGKAGMDSLPKSRHGRFVHPGLPLEAFIDSVSPT
jgi:hypothetical protein